MSLDSVTNIGFLTVTEHQRHGLIGGYLVLNYLGRPVEFHCTSPVRTSRAQEILYGVTLNPFLYGEQIAQLLIRRAKIKPNTILTDIPHVLAVQEFVETSVCYIAGFSDKEKPVQFFNDETQTVEEMDSVLNSIAAVPGISLRCWSDQRIGRYQLAVPELGAHSAEETVDELKSISPIIDFLEPFERIRLAIAEAQKAA